MRGSNILQLILMTGHVPAHPNEHPEDTSLTLIGTDINFSRLFQVMTIVYTVHLHTIVLCDLIQKS